MLETILGGLLLAGALVPIGVALYRTRGPRTAVLVSVLIVAAASAMLYARAGLRSPEPSPRPAEASFDGYVSSNTCRSCHPHEYATWKASYHRTMTQYPTPENVLGNFDDVHLERNGIGYDLSRTDGGFWVEWNDPGGTPNGTGPRRVRRQLVLMTGSHRDQMYWYASPGHGDALEQFPFDFSRRLGRWIPVASSFLQPPDDPRDAPVGHWNATCANCHTVRPDVTWKNWEPPFENASMESRVGELGIACEACHGPGQRHVDANRDPLRRYREHLEKAGDSTIVQPADLDSRRSAEVCGQCHGIWVPRSDSARFVPGMDLRDQRVLIQPRYLDPGYRPRDDRDGEDQERVREVVRNGMDLATLYWPDGQVRVSGREYTAMIQSPCFERGSLTCVSCHTLHKRKEDPRTLMEWADKQVSLGMAGDQGCLQCHGSYVGSRLVSHTRHSPASSGSRCYNCHMPYTVYGIQKGHRNHTVSSPSTRESIDMGRPNACNLCHLDRSLDWTAAYLSRWYDLPESLAAHDGVPVAAGVRWALEGAAGQRALTAWSMGWEPARIASGAMGERAWTVPYLGQLLNDPYDSVRFVSLLALRKYPGFDGFDYDFAGSPDDRRATALRIRDGGVHDRDRDGVDGSAVLLDGEGTLLLPRFEALLEGRDDSPVLLAE